MSGFYWVSEDLSDIRGWAVVGKLLNVVGEARMEVFGECCWMEIVSLRKCMELRVFTHNITGR